MWDQLQNIILQFGWRDALDISLIAFILYKLIILVRGTRAIQLLKGLMLLLIATLGVRQLGLTAIDWLLRQVMTIGLIAIPIVFQPELRRGLEQLGRGKMFVRTSYLYREKYLTEVIGELVKAIQVLVKNRIGALIIMERETGINEFIETGIRMESHVSAELLINIFMPRTPLHDGAVIIRGSRIMAAGCYLPLTENPHLSKELGTRHRAAIGISENSDAVAIVVSEETGAISLANNGKLTRYLDYKTLEKMLFNLFKPPSEPTPFWQWRSTND